jgi:molybdopterin converting factor small subunit
MVQTVTLPLSALNAIPGVSGLDDVTFDIPQVSDIEGAVDDVVGELRDRVQDLRRELDEGLDDVVEEVTDELDGLEDEVAEAVADEVGDVPLPDEDDLTDAILDALDVDEGLFGPLDEPLDSVVENAVEDAVTGAADFGIDLTGLTGTVDDIQATVDDLTQGLEDLDTLGTDAVRRVVDDALDEVEPTVDDSGLFTDPVQFAVALATEAVDRAVDEDTQERLQAVLED